MVENLGDVKTQLHKLIGEIIYKVEQVYSLDIQ